MPCKDLCALWKKATASPKAVRTCCDGLIKNILSLNLLPHSTGWSKNMARPRLPDDHYRTVALLRATSRSWRLNSPTYRKTQLFILTKASFSEGRIEWKNRVALATVQNSSTVS